MKQFLEPGGTATSDCSLCEGNLERVFACFFRKYVSTDVENHPPAMAYFQYVTMVANHLFFGRGSGHEGPFQFQSEGGEAVEDVRQAAEERAARPKKSPVGAGFESERQREMNALVRQLDAQDGRNVRKIAAATMAQEYRILRVAA